jgi:hypothetical protein
LGKELVVGIPKPRILKACFRSAVHMQATHGEKGRTVDLLVD